MATDATLEFTLAKLELKAGDILVVKAGRFRLSMEQQDRLVHNLRKIIPQNVKILLIDPDQDLTVLHPTPDDELPDLHLPLDRGS